jgi:hypothetical protein
VSIVLSHPVPEYHVIPDEDINDRPMDERALRARDRPDATIPWAAIELLNLSPREPMGRVRSWMRRGHRPRISSTTFWNLWQDVIDQAESKVLKRPISEWIEAAYRDTDPVTGECGEFAQVVRDAALINPRSFSYFIGLRDDEGRRIVYKDFHIWTIDGMRKFDYFVGLLPFEFGKSFLSNIVVPLMDFSEWCDATQIRIYWAEQFAQKWLPRLMSIINTNEDLHKLFPWVRKPRKEDRPDRPLWWSSKGFTIAGRTLDDRSFTPLTASQYTTGPRASRAAGDDWVNNANAQIRSQQDRLTEYFMAGVWTMPQTYQRVSTFGTVWGSASLLGTLFSQTDCNKQVYDHIIELKRSAKHGASYKALRVDCYERGREENDSIWPEYKDKETLLALRESLTPRVFNMRCRNIIGGWEQLTFPKEVVVAAEYDGVNRPPYEFGQIPQRTRGYIGFDPGSGKITRESKNPAWAVYGQRDDAPEGPPGLLRDPFYQAPPPDIWHHVIEWGRMEGFSFTRQCDKLAEIYRRIGWPIAFEDNTLQTSYAEYMERFYPDVRMIPHHTGQNVIDPVDGVEQFEPIFRNYRIIIHAAKAPRDQLLALREELTTWKGRYTDIVMALWIAKSKFTQRERLEQKRPISVMMPTYVRSRLPLRRL